MKKLFLIVMLYAVGIFAQSHNIYKDLYGAVIARDSVRFVTDSSHIPIQDSVHIINTGLVYEYAILTIDSSQDVTLDSLKISGGTIMYNYRGSAVDTLYGDESIIRDSSWTIRQRAVASYTGGKSYTIFPLPQLIKIELINHRDTKPERWVNYTLTMYKRSR